MTHQEIRKRFLDFFERNGHKIVPSSSLIPSDHSVLFTTAGMQQFKPYYTNPENAPAKNVASIQKCLRTSDIDEVGDESHLTFFEMMGNFSFGGYGKKEAIRYAYEFITKELGLEIDYVSVFGGEGEIPADEESEKIWKSIDPAIEVKRTGKADNFWGPTGLEGPCGPTTEIFVKGSKAEVWNIVFNEYYCTPGKSYKKLERLGVDTGMGLERLAMVVQKKSNIFETDIFEPILNLVKSRIPNPLDGERSYKIIVDHLRASTLLISEGLRPGKKERESILRKLIRRATMHAILFPRNINNTQELERVLTTGIISSGDFTNILMGVYDYLEEVYPELKDKKKNTERVLHEEVNLFNYKIKEGEEQYFKFGKKISGKEAFFLQQNYGFQIELIRELAKRDGKDIDETGFRDEMLKHQERSRVGVEKKFGK